MKIGVVSLGCPKNLVDSETMLGLIHEENYEITNDPSEAEIIIVNTCGFIESAKEESINTICRWQNIKIRQLQIYYCNRLFKPALCRRTF